jgi:hypothetical protein
LINAQTVGLIEFKLLYDNSNKLEFNIVLENNIRDSDLLG